MLASIALFFVSLSGLAIIGAAVHVRMSAMEGQIREIKQVLSRDRWYAQHYADPLPLNRRAADDDYSDCQ